MTAQELINDLKANKSYITSILNINEIPQDLIEYKNINRFSIYQVLVITEFDRPLTDFKIHILEEDTNGTMVARIIKNDPDVYCDKAINPPPAPDLTVYNAAKTFMDTKQSEGAFIRYENLEVNASLLDGTVDVKMAISPTEAEFWKFYIWHDGAAIQYRKLRKLS